MTRYMNGQAVFNAAGQQTNAEFGQSEFGQYTAARPSRRIQLTLRIDF